MFNRRLIFHKLKIRHVDSSRMAKTVTAEMSNLFKKHLVLHTFLTFQSTFLDNKYRNMYIILVIVKQFDTATESLYREKLTYGLIHFDVHWKLRAILS